MRGGRRFIPAHAGNSLHGAVFGVFLLVHPRARGEQRNEVTEEAWYYGSSPRTRGTDERHGRSAAPRRFIPAHAGNRSITLAGGEQREVHPRARGEQFTFRSMATCSAGSSPRTRGTADGQRLRSAGRRFIPAHAGNSDTRRVSGAASTVHPRARGEQWARMARMAASAGSSPRTRGTERARRGQEPHQRFIPAHAGNRLHLTY